MSAATPHPVVARCAALLESSGLHAVLADLNTRTRHRYTGVYAFDPPTLRSLCLFDRENPGIIRGGDTPMVESYCSIVGGDAAPYATADASRELRLNGHPARASVLAYCGVPLRDDAGTCFGTLCHFDVRPRLVPADEIPVLEQVALLIPPYALTLLQQPSRQQRLTRTPVPERVQIRTHDEPDQRQR